MNKFITYEEFMAEENWKDNIQYLTTMLQNEYIELSTVIKILKHQHDE